MKTILFNGVKHVVPDDATDDEITDLVGGADQRAAPIAPPEDSRPDWIKRQDESAGIPMAPNMTGRMLSGFVPGVGIASGVLGKELQFDDPNSVLPTGIEDVPTVAGNLREGNYGTAALQALGVVPDVGYVAAAPKAIAGAARAAKAAPGKAGDLVRAMQTFKEPPKPVSLTAEQVANPLTKSATGAVDELRAAFQASGLTPERFEAKMRQLGPGAVPADVDELSGLHALVSRTPGAPSQTASRVLGAREATAPTRIADAIKDTLSAHGYHETKNALDAIEPTAVSPLYKRAFESKVPVWNDRMAEMIADPKIQKGLKDSIENEMTIARARGETPKLSDWGVTGFNEAGEPILSEVPTIKLIDAAKKTLDKKLDSFRHPITRQLDTSSRDVQATTALRKSLVDEADKLAEKNPETGESFYSEARAESQRYKKMRDALETGYNALDNSAIDNAYVVKGNPEKYLDPLSPEELELAQRGLAQRLLDRVSSKSETPETLIKALQSKETLDKMRPLFPTTADFNKFRMATISEARKIATARKADIEGAATRTGKDASKLADDAEPTIAEKAADLGMDAATMGKTAFVKRSARAMMNAFSKDKDSRPIAGELADFLYSSDEAKRARVMARIRGDEYFGPQSPSQTRLPSP